MDSNGISSVLVVRNEEAGLEELLRQLKECTDEIVIVDQESTDRTPEIAKRYASTYVTDTKRGYPEPSLPLALSLSSYRWNLRIDGDELLTTDFINDVRGLIQHGDVYRLIIEEIIGTFDDAPLFQYLAGTRLFKKDKVIIPTELHVGIEPDAPCELYQKVAILHYKTWEEQEEHNKRYIDAGWTGPLPHKEGWR